MKLNITKTKLIGLVLLAACLAGCVQEDPAIEQTKKFISQQSIDKSKPDWKIHLTQPPEVKFTPEKSYFWDLQTTQGNMSIKLMPDVAPMHVSSTIYLTTLNFYDDLIFHRVISGFMAQGGDPYGNGMGGPGYKYGGEFSPSARHNKAGILSMANAGPNTDGSQFFITFRPTPHLNGRHTVFGETVSGMETLQKIEKLGSRSGKTTEEIKIIKATIRVE